LIRPPAEVYARVKERAGAKCQHCKVPIDSGHVHHKNSKKFPEDFNDFRSLLYLCPECHALEHHASGRRRKRMLLAKKSVTQTKA
jgi:Zn finger protein HypA/HybF involved in hydrogenase expression